MKTLILTQDDRGATAIEYGLVAALIAMAVIGAMSAVAAETSDMWGYVSNTLGEAIQ